MQRSNRCGFAATSVVRVLGGMLSTLHASPAAALPGVLARLEGTLRGELLVT